MLAVAGVMILSLSLAVLAADAAKPAAQTKTGTVKKVDAAAKEDVVMVTREMTFTVNEATKIMQGDAAKKLEDIKVDDKVSVEYTKDGEKRLASKITILPKEEKK